MAIKTKYHVKNSDGQYEIFHFETSAEQVIVSDDKQFITAEEKEFLAQPKHYVHNQMSASSDWLVQHDLGRYPSVSIVDSAGSLVIGEVVYLNTDSLQINFSSGFAGIAYLN